MVGRRRWLRQLGRLREVHRRGERLHAALLALFGVAMAISFGPKEPLDYSVFSACAAALLLARRTDRPEAGDSTSAAPIRSRSLVT